MKCLATSILALGLAAVVGTASAQSGYSSSGYYPQQPRVDRYGSVNGGQYDYARVVRVDPVIGSGYSSNDGYGYPASQQRCYPRQDGYYAGDYLDDGNYRSDYRNDGYRNDGYRNDGYRNDSYNRNGGSIATVIGGVIGAALGSQVGGGSARYATAAVGSMVGGMAGRQIYESNHRYRQPRTGVVTVCDPVPVGNGGYANNGYYDGNYPGGSDRVVAYDVTYEYAGRRYTTRTNYNPGDSIRVRVDVRPE